MTAADDRAERPTGDTDGDGDTNTDSDVTTFSSDSLDTVVTRRAVLGALGATALSASGATTRLTTGLGGNTDPSDATVHVRVYPTPMPVPARLRRGWPTSRDGLFPVHQDALEAVQGAIDQFASYASNAGVGDFDTSVEPGAPVDLPVLSRVETDPDDIRNPVSQEAILDAFHDELHEREVLSGSTCHLLLWWNPFNYDLGYGGTRSPNNHVTAVDGEGSQTVANIGATEFWDSRAVTNNIAIHEALHTFLSPDVVEDVVGSRCDHDLGSAVRLEEGEDSEGTDDTDASPDETVMEVSPMATAYAGPDEFGGGTRFHGTGCYDHDSFSHHDGTEDVDRWEYTTDLSDATLEALTLYLERHLVPSV